jgi:amino acid transporter
MIYGVFFSHVICKKRFPFEDAFGDINLNTLNKRVNKEDISKSPEFLLLLLTMMYMIFIVALVIIEPSNIPIPHFEIDGWTYPFYTIALFCLLLIVTFFSLLGTYRLFFRKKKKIEPQVFFYIKSLRFDMYWIFITSSLLTLSFIGLISFYLTDLLIYFLMIIFISIFIIAYLNAYLHYNMNDFDMF